MSSDPCPVCDAADINLEKGPIGTCEKHAWVRGVWPKGSRTLLVDTHTALFAEVATIVNNVAEFSFRQDIADEEARLRLVLQYTQAAMPVFAIHLKQACQRLEQDGTTDNTDEIIRLRRHLGEIP